MSVTVTLHISSGLPDPAWELTTEQVAQLRAILDLPGKRSLMKPPGIVGHLGYRGFSIESVGEGAIESSMYVHGGVLDVGRLDLTIIDKDQGLENFLLSTLPFNSDVSEFVREQMKDQSSRALQDQEIDEPPYEPSKWNNDSNVRTKNNCYNYANDKITNTFAQPGRGSGSVGPFPPSCGGTGTAAERDRLLRVASPDLTPAEGQIVALVIADRPGFQDYHWYRRDSNGRWSHKPGQTPARNTDNAGRVIDSPETCDRGPYTVFCGYYHAIPRQTLIS